MNQARLSQGHRGSKLSGYEKTDSCRGSNDSWLVKIDSLGTLIWDKTYGGDGEETVDEVLQSLDGSYSFATSSGSNVIGEKSQAKMGWFDYWLVKVNSNGDKIWDGTYGGKIVQEGTYTWKINFKVKSNDERKMETGHVILIR